MHVVVVEVASDVAGNAGLSCSVLVPSSCGVRSSSIRSDRKLLDGAGCWSSMCKIGVLSPDGLVHVMVMFELCSWTQIDGWLWLWLWWIFSVGIISVVDVGVNVCVGLLVGIISAVDISGLVGVNVGVGVCDAGVIVF